MLADELDYVVGVDTHRDEHVLAVVTAPRVAVVAEAAVGRERARLSVSASVRGAARGRSPRLGDRGHRQLRRRPGPLTSRPRRERCSRSAARRERAAVARQGRRARRGPDGAGGTCQRDARAAAQRGATRGVAAAAGRASQRRRRPPRSAHAAARRDRHRSRPAPRRAARTAGREAARPLQPPSPLHSRAADELAQARAAQPRPPHPSGNPRSRRARTEILAHVRALAPALLDEPGVGPIVAAQLIVAWSHPGRLRSEAAFARLAGVAPDPRLQRPNTRHRSAAAATANSTAPSTPSSSTAATTTQPPRTTSPDASPKAKPAATPPAYSSATSPATSTDYSNNRPADDLTSHRSIIPEHWPGPPALADRVNSDI